MKDLKKAVINDMNRSLPTLGAGSSDMRGWCARMIRTYGSATLAPMMAEFIRKSPSPTIPQYIRDWSDRQPKIRWKCDIPFWTMLHLSNALIQIERSGVRLAAESPNRPVDTSVMSRLI